MTPDDIKVELHEDRLMVSGEKNQERKEDKSEGGFRVHRSERTFTKFTRSFVLPEDARVDGISAHMDNGVLTVDM
jgi:HSP20 family protein